MPAANKALLRTYPPLRRLGRAIVGAGAGFATFAAPGLRTVAAVIFGFLALGERTIRRGAALAVRLASAASEVLTPRRVIGVTIAAAGVCLLVSQFIDYRGVEIGKWAMPGYPTSPGRQPWRSRPRAKRTPTS